MAHGQIPEAELDVRPVRKPERHPLIFARFAELAVGESFVLVNSHDPKHLREEFETDHPGEFSWKYEQQGPDAWRIRITKGSPPLPQLLCDVSALLAQQHPDGPAGAIWRLATSGRQLDANVVHVPAGDHVSHHSEPDLDVLLFVVDGDGVLSATDARQVLRPGALLWLPRGSSRQIEAGARGLSYLTVHLRRPGLSIRTVQNGGKGSLP